jgi:hypothetical protein
VGRKLVVERRKRGGTATHVAVRRQLGEPLEGVDDLFRQATTSVKGVRLGALRPATCPPRNEPRDHNHGGEQCCPCNGQQNEYCCCCEQCCGSPRDPRHQRTQEDVLNGVDICHDAPE